MIHWMNLNDSIFNFLKKENQINLLLNMDDLKHLINEFFS